MTSARFQLVFQPSEPIHAEVFALEARTFDRTYGVAYDDHVAEFAPYESASAFLAVLAEDGRPVGFMRLITPGPAGLKTLHEAGGEPWCIDGYRAAAAVGVDPDRTWDVASLGVGKGLGRHRFAVTAAMYHGLAVAARRNRVRSLLMTVDERVRSILQVAGLFTTALPGAKPGPFCGSPASTTVYGHCAQMLSRQRRENPEAFRLITQGVGLEDVAVPAPSHFDLATAGVGRPLVVAPLPRLAPVLTLIDDSTPVAASA